MTNRVGQLDEVWAQNGTATDPDLDTTHPIFQADKYVKGWIVEKEPHQWQNFLYQITDLKMQFMAGEQFSEWDSAVSYAANAITRKGDAVYVNISGAVALNKDPATQTAVWSEVLGADAATVNTDQLALEKQITDHINADNPHNDNIHDIGGYEKGEIDDFLGSPTDPRTIVYHELQTGGTVHAETPAQVGTLPKSGGHFTGDVKYLGGLTIGTGNIMQDGPDVQIVNGGGAIILEADGDSVYGQTSTGVRSEITTKANIERQQRVVNSMFALPQKIIDVDFRAGSLSMRGIGQVTFDSQSLTPAFTDKGWTIDDSLVLGLEFHFPRTDLVEYYTAEGVFRRILVESTVALSGSISMKDIMTRIAPDAVSVMRILVWPSLTKYQKSNLLPQYDSLLIQNDTSSTPGSAWYIGKDDTNIFSMPNATAPKNAQYIGAFIWNANGTRGSRVDNTAVWTSSDPSVVLVGSGTPTSSGQAIINIVKAGTAVLTVKWKGQTAKVTITVV